MILFFYQLSSFHNRDVRASQILSLPKPNGSFIYVENDVTCLSSFSSSITAVILDDQKLTNAKTDLE
jgi:hypothetical protein